MSIWIKQFELALRFRKGDFVDVIGPGRYRAPWLNALRGERIEVVSLLETRFKHRLLDVLVKNEALASKLHVLDLTDTQRALVWKDGRLAWILGAGRHAFWKTPYTLEFEIFDVDSGVRFEHPKLDVILGIPGASTFLGHFEASGQTEMIVFRDGAPIARFDKGRYVYWKDGRAVTANYVDLRERVADVAGQEIMTRDKVTLRVNLVVTSQVVDALASVTVVVDAEQALYREAQLALRAAVGARSLDELLTDKQAVGGEVMAALAQRAKDFGVEVKSVGLRDISLPGEMKAILNQVITAQKQAEANVIKRREETAASRSQANTAKLLAESPALARMKELEVLQEILAGARTEFVFGKGDLLTQVLGLVKSEAGNGTANKA